MANRQRLYRGKRKDNGEWIEGSLIISGESCFISTGRVNVKGLVACDKLCFEIFEVIPETVCEWTGLEDKNDKLIFEDDIIVTNKFRTPEIKYTVVYDKTIAAYIGIYQDCYTYRGGCVEGFTSFDNDGDMFEVIGNIHDNPELLEV